MAYATISKPSSHFNTKVYTGNGSVRTETGVGFQPDLTWIKDRTGTNAHTLTDAVRGANKQIYTNLNNAETNASGYLTAFASDGFTLGTDGAVNTNSSNYASFNWKGNGADANNTDGSTATVTSTNTTAGFSIVKFTTPSSGTFTLGHGLGAVPKVWIHKSRGTTDNWQMYHHSLGNTKKIMPNATNVPGTSAIWQDTTPTNSIMYLGDVAAHVNAGTNYIAYCWSEIPGYSKFGEYKGNGNDDGPFIYCGFKPAWILIKNTQQGGDDWILHNNKFPGFNVNNQYLYANTTNAQINLSTLQLDMLSNGFKIRKSTGAFNNNNEKMIYMAFAEQPLVANVEESIPATAR